MSILDYKQIQNEQTTIGTGDYISVASADNLVMSIYGTSTSFSITFLGSLDGINYFSISGTKLADPLSFSATSSKLDEAWEFDVSGLNYCKASLTAIANGNISVVANAHK